MGPWVHRKLGYFTRIQCTLTDAPFEDSVVGPLGSENGRKPLGEITGRWGSAFFASACTIWNFTRIGRSLDAWEHGVWLVSPSSVPSMNSDGQRQGIAIHRAFQGVKLQAWQSAGP